MNKVHVRKDDSVIVISGDSKGTKGKVIAVSPKEGKVIVEGANIVSKHVKPKKQGEAGGITKVEGAIYASKVALVCSNAKCANNGKATRAKIKVDEKTGEKIRVCAKCGQKL
ncbi:MAG: 50S ribosomal protein L24 [Clostridia bacterium]|nr:50S ribosomal protein L24 [Clostridia bacterium]